MPTRMTKYENEDTEDVEKEVLQVERDIDVDDEFVDSVEQFTQALDWDLDEQLNALGSVESSKSWPSCLADLKS